MKVNELRIGNYINTKEEIISIQFDSINFIKKQEYIIRLCNGDFINETELKPIPLTEDWLVKFGFEKRYEDCFEYGKFILNDKFIMMNIDITIKLKHVHQLQNLYFALTGEELEVNE